MTAAYRAQGAAVDKRLLDAVQVEIRNAHLRIDAALTLLARLPGDPGRGIWTVQSLREAKRQLDTAEAHREKIGPE